jgi:hypothetical protein
MALTAGGFAALWGLPGASGGGDCVIDGVAGTWQFSADPGVGGPGAQGGEGATYSCFGLRICCVPVDPQG